jgi:putative heme-binding domain-containing protein
LGDFEHPRKTEALAAIVRADPADPWIRAAVLSALKDDAIDLLKAAPPEFRRALLYQLGARNKYPEIEKAMSFLQDAEIKDALAFAEGQERAGSSIRSAKIFDRAVKTAKNPQASDRLAAVQLIGLTRFERTQPMLLSLIQPGEAESIQRTAVAALARVAGSNIAGSIVQQWPSLTPAVRAEALSLLVGRVDRARVLLRTIAAGNIQRSELSSAQIKFLTTHSDDDLKAEALKVLGGTSDAKRQDIVDKFSPALGLTGDAAKGQQVFRERCASCHRAASEGYTLGPDLITVKSAGKEKLLLSIIDPNREVLPNFTSYLVETKWDESYIGILSETGSDVVIREAFGKETRLPRSKVKRIASQSQSLMPEGLEAGLTAQGMADLLEFLSSTN